MNPFPNSAHLPREHRVAGREHHGSEHAEDHREQGRGVDAERHRGDVLSPGAAHELQGQPRVGEVAGKNAERGPRHHALEHEVGRELEDADQQRGEDDELRDVVEGEAEEAGWVLARPGVGHPLVGDHLTGQARYALGQGGAPGETTAVVGDFAEIELDGRADALSEPQSGEV